MAQNLKASELAAEFGRTASFWSRLASSGQIPGAWQPSGKGGAWLFDIEMFREWQRSKMRITARSSSDWTAPDDGTPLSEQIDRWLATAIGEQRIKKAPKSTSRTSVKRPIRSTAKEFQSPEAKALMDHMRRNKRNSYVRRENSDE